MLSYQHAYHAGNAADVHKHFVLAELLRLLTKKDRGVSYLETHAGRGLYDLTSEEAQKTGEAALGIDRVEGLEGTPIGDALEQVRAQHGETAYPGSPLIASSLLREQDKIALMEMHPQEHRALRRAMKGSGAAVHNRDAYEGAKALTPMDPRRGLVLIDPPYELKDEYGRAAKLAMTIHKRWPEAAIMVWYPILDAGRHAELLSGMAEGEPLVSEVSFPPKDGRGMKGSGLAIIGAPYGADEAIARAIALGGRVFRP
ncbi:23S rRNA (adenine(2030)-N(6))-methyltransferase RlmJ [Parvularcula sp. ZS-1/3]|uniref:Ribosomal RNA large subunit methyltransferase J n=1 Tax=Parvularcula mediterranea TaxID=2732508 RepID=A0A7Y3RMM7_9PROT|nr:23S rRNA (adenine(2030)-N(6))-methyltransferase RlmJ [Parvularcula mediterranea]NNU16892.1 23S rRNA (adenine(2030)-N(6))-methyltransferase RlmJ [Parvularcula mediterranea]